MRSTNPRYLLDLNALIALADPDAVHYKAIHQWFNRGGKDDWGVCPITESGFIRISTNPAYRSPARTVAQAATILTEFARHPGYRFWPISDSWEVLTAPFSTRIKGHKQITDACLLGLAIRHKGVLVTFDSALAYLAGGEYSPNLLVLRA